MSDTTATITPETPVELPTVTAEATADRVMLRVNPVTQIIVPKLLLREAQTTDEKYAILRNSIASKGQRNPIIVTPGTQPDTYILIDGLQRLTIIKELQIPTILVTVEHHDEAGMLETQVEANLARVDTKLSQYTRLLVQYAKLHPNKTKTELARNIGVSVNFINDRLSFNKLDPSLQSLADDGVLTLGKAVILSGLDVEDQKNLVGSAIQMDPAQFAATVKKLKDDRRKAQEAGSTAPKVVEFVPAPSVRPKADLLGELETLKAANQICETLSSPIDGFVAGLKWALKLDDESVRVGKENFDAQQKLAAEKKKRADEERARKKAAADAAKQAAENTVADSVRG